MLELGFKKRHFLRKEEFLQCANVFLEGKTYHNTQKRPWTTAVDKADMFAG
jgi:hypothetical protein